MIDSNFIHPSVTLSGRAIVISNAVIYPRTRILVSPLRVYVGAYGKGIGSFRISKSGTIRPVGRLT